MAKTTKKTPKKTINKTPKKTTTDKKSAFGKAVDNEIGTTDEFIEISRTEEDFDAFFSELKKGNKTCHVIIAQEIPNPTDKDPEAMKNVCIRLHSVKANPHLTSLVNESANDWMKGDI